MIKYSFLLNFQYINAVFGILVVILISNLYAMKDWRAMLVGTIYGALAALCILVQDLFTVFCVIEIMIVFSCILIFKGHVSFGRASIVATKEYFITHIFSSSLILMSINSYNDADTIYLFLFFGLLINIACPLFIGWMINCYPVASNYGFLYLIAFTTKVSLISIAKFFYGFALCEFFGIFMMVYGSLFLCHEISIKKSICYLNIAQMGFILILIAREVNPSLLSIYIALHLIQNCLIAFSVVIICDKFHVHYWHDFIQCKNKLFKYTLLLGIYTVFAMPFSALSLLKTSILCHISDLTNIIAICNILQFLVIPRIQILRFSKVVTVVKLKLNNNEILGLCFASIVVILSNIYIIFNYAKMDLMILSAKQALYFMVALCMLYFIGPYRVYSNDGKSINLLIWVEDALGQFGAFLDKVGFLLLNLISKLQSILYVDKFRIYQSRSSGSISSSIIAIFAILSIVLLILSQVRGETLMSRSEVFVPRAKIVNHEFNLHGQIIQDNYAWLRDANWPQDVSSPDILEYLGQENSYFESFFHPLNQLKNAVFEELKGKIKLDDESLYVKKDSYYYYTKTLSDKEYPLYCRKYGSLDAKEEVLLDVNLLAIGKQFVKVGAFAISPDHNLMSYSIDYEGNERYKIVVFDITAQKYLKDEIENTIGNIVWHEEINGFFYSNTNDQWRADKVLFHKIGQDSGCDSVILHEPDPLYSAGVTKSSSKQYIIIDVSGHSCNEIYLIPMKDHSMKTHLIQAKVDKVLYDIDHGGSYLYLCTNQNAINFQLMRAELAGLETVSRLEAVSGLEHLNWRQYIDESKDEYLEGFDLTKNYLILHYKKHGLDVVKVRDIGNELQKVIKFPDASYVASGFSTNFEENDIRISYSSLSKPSTVYGYDFELDRLSVLKVQEIPSGFDTNQYNVERIFAKSRDGTLVPISIMYKKSLFKKDGTNPLYLYGYGSYGYGVPSNFRISAIPLVDRGFVFCIAHIRGGNELGHQWYEDAKFLSKKRTFEDFISCAEHLIDNRYTNLGKIVISGGSAGGMLVGNVINEKPELFSGAIAHVPFVDVLNTMLDESLPLTPSEFKEWGNPQDEKYFHYMRSYSPYDNVKRQNYPALMVTAGISDPRVGYWEAAKWVAKLRANKTDRNILILKTNMNFGHSGASGRFDYLKEIAEDIVFAIQICA